MCASAKAHQLRAHQHGAQRMSWGGARRAAVAPAPVTAVAAAASLRRAPAPQPLRFAPRLRVHPRVTILDVLTLPEGVTFMRSRKSHKVNPTDVQPCPNIRGGYTDGYVTFYPLDAPAPTQMGTAPNWDAADFVTDVGRLSADDCRALATFPTSFRWPPKATKKDAEEGYGNCVPPLFVQKLFRAASTTVA